MIRILPITLLIALGAAVGSADAQTPDSSPVAATGPQAIDRPDARALFSIPYARSNGPAPDGMSRTAIDHRFASGGLTGSVGYLCGVNSFAPGANETGGPASTFGRGTTFLGAKLSLPFR